MAVGEANRAPRGTYGLRVAEPRVEVVSSTRPAEEELMPETSMPEVGSPAPAIRATTTNSGDFDLAEQTGKWVVVYFYPRANTPG